MGQNGTGRGGKVAWLKLTTCGWLVDKPPTDIRKMAAIGAGVTEEKRAEINLKSTKETAAIVFSNHTSLFLMLTFE